MDTPGFGGRQNVHKYFENIQIEPYDIIVFVIDASKPLLKELEIYKSLIENKIPFVFICSRIDAFIQAKYKLNTKESKEQAKKELSEENCFKKEIFENIKKKFEASDIMRNDNFFMLCTDSYYYNKHFSRVSYLKDELEKSWTSFEKYLLNMVMERRKTFITKVRTEYSERLVTHFLNQRKTTCAELFNDDKFYRSELSVIYSDEMNLLNDENKKLYDTIFKNCFDITSQDDTSLNLLTNNKKSVKEIVSDSFTRNNIDFVENFPLNSSLLNKPETEIKKKKQSTINQKTPKKFGKMQWTFLIY